MKIKKTLAFIGMLVLCLGLMALFAQQTTREGWLGFNRIIQVLDRNETAVNQVYNEFVVLKKLKVNIIDDAALLAEVVKVIDVHPDYTAAGINSMINTYEAALIDLIEAGVIADSRLQTITVVEGGFIYVGYSIHFTRAGEAKWAVKRAAEPTPPDVPVFSWADGARTFEHAWTDRTTLTY